MKQLKVSLPDGLRAQLDAASAKSGQSVAEEIRSRVEASFAREAVDKPTRDLLEGVALMAAEIERERGAAWHKHAGAHEVLTRAIQMRLGALKPEGSIAFDANWPHATVSGDDPNQLGALIEFRLRQQPDFTRSATRQWMEEEHRRSRAFLAKPLAERLGHPVPPPPGRSIPTSLINEPPQQDKKDKGQQKPDQPKKRGK